MQKSIGNITEFESVFKEYFNPLVNFVNKYLNNYENSREVVQLTFVKLWNNKDGLEIKSSLKSYLFQMTKNTMIDFIRKNKNHLKMAKLESVDTEYMAFENEQYLDPYIIRQAIEKCLKDLKPKAREIFELNKFEGLTYEEIADHLQISKRSVEDNISKILKFLQEELKNHPDFFE